VFLCSGSGLGSGRGKCSVFGSSIKISMVEVFSKYLTPLAVNPIWNISFFQPFQPKYQKVVLFSKLANMLEDMFHYTLNIPKRSEEIFRKV
jgi:hypothetical protein